LHNKFDKTYQAGHFHKNVFLWKCVFGILNA
jgi:hypothetical protein